MVIFYHMKRLPYNLDGTGHECRPSIQKLETNKKEQLTLEDLDTSLKKVEHTLYGN
jgi:hypothetical protein